MRLRRGLFAALLMAATACGGSSTSPSPNNGLTVMLKDSPFSDARALLVTFSTVSVHMSGGNFMTVPFSGGATTGTCDLKKLTSAQNVLGTGASATIYFDNASSGATACAASLGAPAGRSAPVTIPPGEAILNREFDVTSTTTTTITLDFDGDQSVKDTGNGTFLMTPVISVVSVQ